MTPAPRRLVEVAVLPLLRDLSSGDRRQLERLLAVFPADDSEVSLAACLNALYGSTEEDDQAKFRAFRSRVAKASGESGFEIEVDSRKRSDAVDRVVTLQVDASWQTRSFLQTLTGYVAGHRPEMTVPPPGIATTGSALENKKVAINVVGAYAERDSSSAELFGLLREQHFGISRQFAYNPWTPNDILLGSTATTEIDNRVEEADFVIVGLSPSLLGDRSWMRRIEDLRCPLLLVQTVPTTEAHEHGVLAPLVRFHLDGKAYSELRTIPQREAFATALFTKLEASIVGHRSPKVSDDELPEIDCNHEDAKKFLGPTRDLIRYTKPRAARITGLPDPGDPAELQRLLGEGKDAREILDRWADDPEASPYCVVLGEYGIGKTTLLRHFTYERLERAGREKDVPLTVLVDLRNALSVKRPGSELRLEVILDEMLRRAWQSTAPQTITANDVLRWVREERAILIFDGLDEVLVHLSPSEGQALIREFWRALPVHEARHPERGARCGRLIFSCRSSYFHTIKAQAAAFTGQNRDLRNDDYLALVMLPFDEDQIKDYLSRALGEDAESALATIHAVHNLRDLAARPYLLSLISEEIGRLERLREQGKTLRSVDLYDGFAEKWLLRDDGKHTVSPLDKERLTERLAAAMWAEGQREWPWTRLRRWLHEEIRRDPTLAMIHLGSAFARDLLEEDFRTATFILRPDGSLDTFRFAHTSLQEYFLARHLRRALDGPVADARLAWAIPRPSDETLAFVGELLTRPGGERGLATLAEILTVSTPGTSENAFRYWLLARRRNLPEPTPRHVDLSGRDLFQFQITGTPDRWFPLAGADFRGADLRRSEWRYVDVAEARFDEGEGYGVTFERYNAQDTTFERFTGGIARHGNASPGAFFWSSAELDQSLTRGIASTSFGHGNDVECCVISPDGKSALSGANNVLILWDVESGRVLRTLKGHTNTVTTCAFSADGKCALTGSRDNVLIFWDLELERVLLTLRGHTSTVTSCAVSGNGKLAISGSHDKTLILWDLDSGSALQVLAGHTNWVTSCAISPDGKRALSGSWDDSLIYWDLNNNIVIKILKEHTNFVTSCAFSSDGKRALSGSYDGTLILWNLERQSVSRILRGHTSRVTSCTFSPDGASAISGSWDHTVILWDVQNGRVLRTLKGHTNHVTSCAFSPDGKRALSGSCDRTLTLWDLERGRVLRILKGHRNNVAFCGISPDGKSALSGSDDRTLILWDVASGQPVRTLEGHKDALSSCAFSPDGKIALSGSDDKTLILWDVASGRPLRTLEGHRSYVYSCAFSPDGLRAISGSDDNTLILWDVASGRPLRTLEGHKNDVNTCAFSPDGKTALSGSDDRTMILWDVVSGRPLRTLEGHKDTVRSCAFSPDGKTALSGSRDHTLILWDVASGRPLRTLEGHKGDVLSCAFSPDGARALSGSWDNTLILWDLATGMPIQQFVHGPEGERAVIDCVTQKFTYLEDGAWRRVHAVGTDPVTGRLRTYPPEAAMAVGCGV